MPVRALDLTDTPEGGAEPRLEGRHHPTKRKRARFGWAPPQRPSDGPSLEHLFGKSLTHLTPINLRVSKHPTKNETSGTKTSLCVPKRFYQKTDRVSVREREGEGEG